MATDPMGEWQGVLPIPPAPQGSGGGYDNPALITEPPGSAPAASPRAPSADRRAQLERTLANPLYRFGSALAGSNPAAEEMRGLQGQDLQERQFALQQKQFQAQMDQFVTSKKLALGGMAVQFLEKVASAKPDQRAALVEIGGQFLGPMLKEIGFELPVNLLKKMTETPGFATRFGALIADNFQDEASQKQVLGEISALDEKDIPDYVAKRWKQAQDAALPRVQQTLVQVAGLIKGGDAAMHANLKLLDDKGKLKAIPGDLLMQQIDKWFKTSAEKATALRVLSGEGEHSKFLARLGIEPGSVAEEQMKIIGAADATASTPLGTAQLKTAEAGATKATAEAGVAGRQAAATTTKMEAEAGTAAEQAKAHLAETRLKVTKLQQETAEGGTAQEKAALSGKARNDYLGMASVRAMQLAQATYGQLKEVAEKPPTPAGDYAIIVNFAKLLDPDTAAREGEQEAVQKAVAKDSKLREWYDLVVGGKTLTTDQRKDILGRGTDVWNGRVKAHLPIQQQFVDFAKRNKLDPADVVVNFGDVIQKAKEGKAVPTITGEPVRAR